MPQLTKKRSNLSLGYQLSFYLKMVFNLWLLVTCTQAVSANQEEANNKFYGPVGFPSQDYLSIDAEFPNLFGINITGLNPECTTKAMGYSPGTVCLVSNKTFWMKVARPDQDIRLSEIANYEFAKNIGVKVPNTGYFLYNNIVYTASEKIKDFTMAKNYFPNNNTAELNLSVQAQFSQITKDLIGSHGIAQISVLRMFIKDLTNVENWGVDKEGKLVVIDADKYPMSLSEFFDNAVKVIDFSRETNPSRKNYKYAPTNLALEDIIAMKKILGKMYHTPLPSVRVNIFEKLRKPLDDNYQPLLKAYIQACNMAIKRINSNKKISFREAAQSNNFILATEILIVAKQNYSQFNIDELTKPVIAEENLRADNERNFTHSFYHSDREARMSDLEDKFIKKIMLELLLLTVMLAITAGALRRKPKSPLLKNSLYGGFSANNQQKKTERHDLTSIHSVP